MNDEKAIEQLEEFLVIDDWSAVYMPYLQDAIEYVINRIKAFEERPQGKWIIHNKGEHNEWHECPFCNNHKKYYARFCDYCGAEMKGDNEENNNGKEETT